MSLFKPSEPIFPNVHFDNEEDRTVFETEYRKNHLAEERARVAMNKERLPMAFFLVVLVCLIVYLGVSAVVGHTEAANVRDQFRVDLQTTLTQDFGIDVTTAELKELIWSGTITTEIDGERKAVRVLFTDGDVDVLVGDLYPRLP